MLVTLQEVEVSQENVVFFANFLAYLDHIYRIYPWIEATDRNNVLLYHRFMVGEDDEVVAAVTYRLDVGSNSVIATPILLKPPTEEGEAREILEEIKTHLRLYGLHIKVINCIREFYELFNTVFADCTLINEGEEN